ncbi:MAG: CDP-glycerol glycerophosphotransferase family protein [Eubacterium sp.]|nr:CDP-glycerol glycerophosphotransferase family protein [Eubacterium sp.]
MNPVVTNISWDRIWISFYIENVPATEHIHIRALNGSYSARLVHPDQSSTEYRLNITNPGNCRMLPVGIYRLVTSDDTPIESAVTDIKKYNTKFVYFHSERSYGVQFSGKNGLKLKVTDGRIKGLDKVKAAKSFVRRSRHDLAKAILRAIYNAEYKIFHDKKHAKPRILLMSDQSEEMGSNMKALKDALLKEGYAPKEALRAITTKHYSILHWIKTLKKIAEADYIFLDDHSQTTDWLTIKGAVITQLWHAGAGFKSTGYSRFGMPASPAPWSGHRQYTYGIAGSKKIRHFFSEVWGINDDMVLPTGMPRLDEFLNEEHKEKVSAELRKMISELTPEATGSNGKLRRIILFAPTYRGENKKHAYYPYEMLDMDRLYELCKLTDSLFIFKMHPFLNKEDVPIPKKYKDRILNLTDYPNINDLFYISDLLITDYSSNIYEYSLMKRPMLFYSFDIESYTKERGFHRDYRTNVPGKIVETFDDLYKAVIDEDFEFEKVQEYVDNNFDHIDDHACERVINWIIKK